MKPLYPSATVVDPLLGKSQLPGRKLGQTLDQRTSMLHSHTEQNRLAHRSEHEYRRKRRSGGRTILQSQRSQASFGRSRPLAPCIARHAECLANADAAVARRSGTASHQAVANAAFDRRYGLARNARVNNARESAPLPRVNGAKGERIHVEVQSSCQQTSSRPLSPPLLRSRVASASRHDTNHIAVPACRPDLSVCPPAGVRREARSLYHGRDDSRCSTTHRRQSPQSSTTLHQTALSQHPNAVSLLRAPLAPHPSDFPSRGLRVARNGDDQDRHVSNHHRHGRQPPAPSGQYSVANSPRAPLAALRSDSNLRQLCLPRDGHNQGRYSPARDQHGCDPHFGLRQDNGLSSPRMPPVVQPFGSNERNLRNSRTSNKERQYPSTRQRGRQPPASPRRHNARSPLRASRAAHLFVPTLRSQHPFRDHYGQGGYPSTNYPCHRSPASPPRTDPPCRSRVQNLSSDSSFNRGPNTAYTSFAHPPLTSTQIREENRLYYTQHWKPPQTYTACHSRQDMQSSVCERKSSHLHDTCSARLLTKPISASSQLAAALECSSTTSSPVASAAADGGFVHYKPAAHFFVAIHAAAVRHHVALPCKTVNYVNDDVRPENVSSAPLCIATPVVPLTATTTPLLATPYAVAWRASAHTVSSSTMAVPNSLVNSEGAAAVLNSATASDPSEIAGASGIERAPTSNGSGRVVAQPSKSRDASEADLKRVFSPVAKNTLGGYPAAETAGVPPGVDHTPSKADSLATSPRLTAPEARKKARATASATVYTAAGPDNFSRSFQLHQSTDAVTSSATAASSLATPAAESQHVSTRAVSLVGDGGQGNLTLRKIAFREAVAVATPHKGTTANTRILESTLSFSDSAVVAQDRAAYVASAQSADVAHPKGDFLSLSKTLTVAASPQPAASTSLPTAVNPVFQKAPHSVVPPAFPDATTATHLREFAASSRPPAPGNAVLDSGSVAKSCAPCRVASWHPPLRKKAVKSGQRPRASSSAHSNLLKQDVKFGKRPLASTSSQSTLREQAVRAGQRPLASSSSHSTSLKHAVNPGQQPLACLSSSSSSDSSSDYDSSSDSDLSSDSTSSSDSDADTDPHGSTRIPDPSEAFVRHARNARNGGDVQKTIRGHPRSPATQKKRLQSTLSSLTPGPKIFKNTDSTSRRKTTTCAKSAQVASDNLNQTTCSSAAAVETAENSNKGTRSNGTATSLCKNTASIECLKMSGAPVLSCHSEAPRAVTLGSSNIVLSHTQKTKSSTYQPRKVSSASFRTSDRSVATIGSVSSPVEPDTPTNNSALKRSNACFSTRKTDVCGLNYSAEGVADEKTPSTEVVIARPLVTLAAVRERKRMCKSVRKVEGSKQKRMRLPPRTKVEANTNTRRAGAEANLQATRVAIRASEKQRSLLVGAAHTTVGATVARGTSAGVDQNEEATAKRGTRRTGAANATPTAEPQRSPLRRAAANHSFPTEALTPPASATVEPGDLHRLTYTSSKTFQPSPRTVVSPPTFASTQKIHSLTFAGASAAPMNLPTITAGYDEPKRILVDGPCACELDPRGLLNIGKTCSFNALLQALSATRVFSELSEAVCQLKVCADLHAVQAQSADATRTDVAAAMPTPRIVDTIQKSHPITVKKTTKSNAAVLTCVTRAPATPLEAVDPSVLDFIKKHTPATGLAGDSGNESVQLLEQLYQRQTPKNLGSRSDIDVSNLPLNTSLAALLCQMRHDVCETRSVTREDNDARQQTCGAAAPATGQPHPGKNMRKQLRVLRQLRSRKRYEQRDELVLNPTEFITQVKRLNAEFQRDAELDVEEVWRFVVDRLLCEVEEECRRLVSLVNQQAEVKDGLLLAGREVHEECRGAGTPRSELLRCRKRRATPAEPGGTAHSNCQQQDGIAVSSIECESQLQQELVYEADGRFTRCADNNCTDAVESQAITPPAQKELTRHHGREPPAAVAAADSGSKVCNSDAKYFDDADTRRSSGVNRGGRTHRSVNGEDGTRLTEEEEKARKVSTVSPAQRRRRCLKRNGWYIAELRSERSESPGTSRGTPFELASWSGEGRRDCLLTANELPFARCSSQMIPPKKQNTNCSPTDRERQQTESTGLATKQHVVLNIRRRLEEAFVGSLVHVPVRCSCCCFCSSVAVSSSPVPDSSPSIPAKMPRTSSATSSPFSNGAVCSSSSSSSSTNSHLYMDSCYPAKGIISGGGMSSDDTAHSVNDTVKANYDPTGKTSNAVSGDASLINQVVCDRDTVQQRTFMMGKRRRRLRRPPKESESGSEVCEFLGKTRRVNAAVVWVHEGAKVPAPVPTQGNAGSKALEGVPSTVQAVGEQNVVVSTSDGCRDPICSQQSKTSKSAFSENITRSSMCDAVETALHQVNEARQHTHSVELRLKGNSTSAQGYSADVSSVESPSFSHSRMSACFTDLASRSTSNHLTGSYLTNNSEDSMTCVLSAPKIPSVLTGKTASSMTPSTPVQEERFSAVLPLRLPDRSRWAASRPQRAASETQASREQHRRSSHQKEKPITLEECLSCALKRTCDGEKAMIGAQKKETCTKRKRAQTTAAKRVERSISTCSQQAPGACQTKLSYTNCNELMLCSECGRFAQVPCNGTCEKAKSSSRHGSNAEGLTAYTKQKNIQKKNNADDFFAKHELGRSRAAIQDAERTSKRTGVNTAPTATATLERPRLCRYCKEVHTQTYLRQLPQLLVLQLQRSSLTDISRRQNSRAAALAFTGGGVKITAHVQFPSELQESLLQHCGPPVKCGGTTTVNSRSYVATTAGVKQRCGSKRYASCSAPSAYGYISPGTSCSTSAILQCPTSDLPSLNLTHAQSVLLQAEGRGHAVDMAAAQNTRVKAYKLRAVIEHQGRSGASGHYVCFRRGFPCQDRSRVSAQQVTSSRAAVAPNGSAILDSHEKSTGPFCFATTSGACTASTCTSLTATGGSDIIASVPACRLPHAWSVSPEACLLETRNWPLSTDAMPPEPTAAAPLCVSQSQEQRRPAAQEVRDEKGDARPNKVPLSFLVPNDRQRCLGQAQAISKELVLNSKQPRPEDDILLSGSEADSRKKLSLRDDHVSPACTSLPRERHCTESTKHGENRNVYTGEHSLSFPSSLASTCATDEGLVSAQPAATVEAKVTKRRRKGDPNINDIPHDEEDWWEVNDAQVCRTTWQQVSLCQAYLLIYELQDPLQAMCKKRHLVAGLRAAKVKGDKAESRRTAETTYAEDTKKIPIKRAAKTISRGRGNKPPAAASGTGPTATASGRKRPRAQAESKSFFTESRQAKTAKRRKQS